MFGHENYASGQTLCLRRETLDAIGGLKPIANHLADDYRLGEMIRDHRLHTQINDIASLFERLCQRLDHRGGMARAATITPKCVTSFINLVALALDDVN